MLPDRQQYIEQLSSQTVISLEAQRRLTRIAEQIPQGALVTLEGPPIYLCKPWDHEHELGYNNLLPFFASRVSSRASQIWHAVLLDDYSASSRYPESEYLDHLQFPYTRIAHESDFVDEAEIELQRLRSEGHTLQIQSATYLSRENRTQAILRTSSGRIGCALLDTLFQQSKGPGWHIILHPRMFKHQQEEMRLVFSTLTDIPDPFHFINIFMKGTNLSQVFHTDSQGMTEEI